MRCQSQMLYSHLANIYTYTNTHAPTQQAHRPGSPSATPKRGMALVRAMGMSVGICHLRNLSFLVLANHNLPISSSQQYFYFAL